MTSAFGWLDTDETQRRQMLEVVELFKDEGSVDELGVGSIRDTIADVLFPGTSVLHSRLRYALFVPWLVNDVARRGLAPQQAGPDLRRQEIKLIHALLEGNGPEGVIGSQARDNLKRMPSAAYWAGLRRWEIRLWDTTIEGHFRKAKSFADLRKVEPTADDPGVGSTAITTGVDPDIPKAPDDLLTTTSFDLTAEESSYLTDQLVVSTKNSLLAWLAPRDDDVSAAPWIWSLESVHEFPDYLQMVVDHGRRFHTAVHGAPLLYNLLLAERVENSELVEVYVGELAEWRTELTATEALDRWDRPSFWAMLRRHNPRMSVRTQLFVDAWIDLVAADAGVEGSAYARDLITSRERDIKRGRARLFNQAALDRWTGRAGLVRLDYRWMVARRLLADLQAGRAAA